MHCRGYCRHSMGLAGPYSAYRRKYSMIAAREAACRNVGRRCGTPADKLHFFTEIDVYGTWPFVIYLQARATECDTRVCVAPLKAANLTLV